METDQGRDRGRRIEGEGRKEGGEELKREGGWAAGVGEGGMETVTAVTVVTSHTVWLSHARSPGQKGCTRSTKHDSLPLIRYN